MSDYTPDTDDVRDIFAKYAEEHHGEQDGDAEFDRWLAAHDAEIRAESDARFAHWTNHAISEKLEAEIRADERKAITDIVESIEGWYDWNPNPATSTVDEWVGRYAVLDAIAARGGEQE